MNSLTMQWLDGRYAVCRFDAHADVPNWAVQALNYSRESSSVVCIVRTDSELSIVIDQSRLAIGVGDAAVTCGADVGPAMRIQRGFAAMRIAGTLNFSQVGVLARITAALADANISVLAITTFDTDYLLVQEHDRATAEQALRGIAIFE